MTVHYYLHPIGDGEFSRNRFRPVCSSTAEPVFIPASERGLVTPPAGSTVCSDCAEIAVFL